MRVRLLCRVLLVLAPALLPVGLATGAPETKPPAKKPAAKKPAAPARPAPAKPAPAEPADPAATQGSNQARALALTRAIAAQEKSEKAGSVFKQFIEGPPAERVKAVAEPAKYGPEAAKYFESNPNRDFKPLGIRILGTVNSPSQPDRLFFPYFVATDKNRRGFVTVVIETVDGFKVDWNTFSRGHDVDLQTFLSEKKPGSTIVFLVGISKSHIFSEGPPGGEARNLAFTIDMPPGPIEEDPAKAFVDKASDVGKLMNAKLSWSPGHLCWLTLAFEGDGPFLTIKAYQPYAK